MAYEWQIANFDALESGLKVKTCSPTFSLGGHSWQLELYPGGYRPDALEHVAAFLRYKGGRAAVRVQFSLSVVSRHGSHVAWRSDETQPVLMGAAPDRALKVYTTYGTAKLCPRAWMHDEAHGLCGPGGEARLCVRVHEVADGEKVKKKRGLLRRLSSRKFNASSKVTHSFSLTGMRRNLKFALGVMPITIKYLRVKMRASKMRKKLKKKEPESYYEQRTKLWDETHETSAVQVRRLFESMGGLYNKMAQDWATRDGLLPPTWIKELKRSFENFAPRPWKQIEGAMLRGLAENAAVAPSRRGLAAYFSDVEQTCLAAASIGQVHAATLYDGRRAIVKVIYPDIRANMRADLANARVASKQIVALMDMPLKDTIDVIMNEFCENFPKELDFENEAAYLNKAREIIARRGLPIYAPEPYMELCSKEILTQEFLRGKTIASLVDSHRGDERVLAQAFDAIEDVAEAIGAMMFGDQFFHADPRVPRRPFPPLFSPLFPSRDGAPQAPGQRHAPRRRHGGAHRLRPVRRGERRVAPHALPHRHAPADAEQVHHLPGRGHERRL
jgi:uncharacterized membrane protein YciS (DUF1049 family)